MMLPASEVDYLLQYAAYYIAAMCGAAYVLRNDGPLYYKTAHNVVAFFKCGLFFILATMATHDLRGSPASRWAGVSPYALEYLRVYIATNVVDIANEFIIARQEGKSATTTIPMLVHHIMSVMGYSMTLKSRQLLFWGAAAGLCEITNLFLVPIYITKMYKGSQLGQWMLKNFETLVLACGFFLWLTFIIFRISLFPMVLVNVFYLLLLARDTCTGYSISTRRFVLTGNREFTFIT